jgi:hypothetical protein
MATITRVGFCPECFKEARPKTGQSFLAIGSSSGTFVALRAIRNGRRGFTPHLYLLSNPIGDKYYFHSMCCMCGCGSYLQEEEGKKFLCLDENKWTPRQEITLKNWNALVLFKDTGFEI